MKKSLGMIIAATVGSLIATSAMADSGASSSAEATVKCMGANACKGQGACQTAANSCKGNNSCKGTGWIFTTSEADCTSKGGTVIKE